MGGCSDDGNKKNAQGADEHDKNDAAMEERNLVFSSLSNLSSAMSQH